MRILAPSEMLEKLKKNVGFKDDGSVEIAKNLEVDGKLKLNSGFEPIHDYVLSDEDSTELVIYVENLIATQNNVSTYNFIGEINGDLIIGRYSYTSQVQEFVATSATVGDYNGVILYEFYGQDIIADTCALSSELDTKQNKLTLHNLTLTANAKTYNITLQSTNNLPVDSIADLRTILNIKATTDSLITPVCASDLTSTACLQITTALCKIGADNVTAVSDKVTTL